MRWKVLERLRLLFGCLGATFAHRPYVLIDLSFPELVLEPRTVNLVFDLSSRHHHPGSEGSFQGLIDTLGHLLI